MLLPPSPPPHPSRLARQSGLGATSFLLTTLPILLLGLGGVELAHGLFVRQALSHALVQAGRAATVDHADPAALTLAFERALHPLFLQPGSLSRALAQRIHDTGAAPWQIRILQPQRAAFADHADPEASVPTTASGLRAINHDYQALQHDRRLGEGWPQGQGPVSGQTIFQANTLTLELVWLHEPLTPGLKTLMRTLSPADESYRSRAMAQGYLPIVRGISLTMQSHPVDWPDRSDGKVVHGMTGDWTSVALRDCADAWNGCAPPSPHTPSEPAAPIQAGPAHPPNVNEGNIEGVQAPGEWVGEQADTGGVDTGPSPDPDC